MKEINEDYILQKDINWFGKLIPKGTIYRKRSADYWWPKVNDSLVPAMQIDLYTVRANEEYFKPMIVMST